MSIATVLLLSLIAALHAAAQREEPQRPEVRPSRTIENLRAAIAGEANAAHRYAVFAQRADREGHHQVAKLFRAAAESERVHRRNHEAVLRDLGEPVPEPRLEEVRVGSTRENLRVPIEGEQEEMMVTYPRFIEEARADGVPAAVASFSYARDAEAGHERLFRRALADLDRPPTPVDYWVHTETGVLEARPGDTQPVTVAAARTAQRAG
ncbi:MAG TPA: rubrerythrin family protein [Sandaracinaceae bacterium]